MADASAVQASETRLTIVSRLGSSATTAAWLRPLISAWPGAKPEGRVVGYDTLCKELSPHDPCQPGQRSLPSQAVVVLASDEEDESNVHRVLDALRRSITPAVVLARGRALRSRLLADVPAELGVNILDWDTGHSEITHALCTLLDRQPLIDAMSREVRLAQLSQRSIAGELEKLHMELHEAAHMQDQFVQRALPYIPGLNIGVVYRPATYVSGDLFDVERLDEHHVSIFLADAVGHGVPAAMLTLFISRALPKLDGVGGSARIVPPAEALTRLNREFCGRPSPSGRFATAVYGVLDTRTMTIDLAGAGHPAAIFTKNGTSDRIESEGPLLGVFPDAEFVSTPVELGDTGRLALFTDGFETAFPADGTAVSDLKKPTDTYIERLTTLAAHAGDAGDLADALDTFEHELDAQMGSLHRPDDVTALLIGADARTEDTAREAA